jgi:RNA polymerase sigma-70 factor (sigma-E family)
VPRSDRGFREFFDAEFEPLRRLAYLLTGNWSEAEDLAQEAMVRVYRAWSRIVERERPAAYARAVLINRHRSLLRRARVEARHAVARSSPAVVPELSDDQVVVWNALAELPPRERAALVLRFYEDMPLSEIAAVLDVPVGTVKSMTHRALGRLRSVLGSDVAVPEDA